MLDATVVVAVAVQRRVSEIVTLRRGAVRFEPMLFELEDLTYTRAGRRVLSNVSLALREGTTALVGPSGAGKSTLLP